MKNSQKKKVSLKGGKIAYLSAYQLVNADITIVTAKNENGKNIAECHFSYTYVFERALSEHERKMISKYSKIPLESVPYVKEFKLDESHAQRFKVSGDEIVFSSGDSYKIKRKYLNLIGIKIIDREFYKVGLGTAILKEVEKLALKNGCDSIEGMYLPNGEFQFGAHDFYKRNGFEFYTDLGVNCIRKQIKPEIKQSGEKDKNPATNKRNTAVE